MKNVNNNLSKILKKEHEGKWVAVSPDYKKVIGYSNTLKELTNKIKTEVVYTKVLPSDTIFAFN
jgi:hypothetical protein